MTIWERKLMNPFDHSQRACLQGERMKIFGVCERIKTFDCVFYELQWYSYLSFECFCLVSVAARCSFAGLDFDCRFFMYLPSIVSFWTQSKIRLCPILSLPSVSGYSLQLKTISLRSLAC